jgi:hypothetical protein
LWETSGDDEIVEMSRNYQHVPRDKKARIKGFISYQLPWLHAAEGDY